MSQESLDAQLDVLETLVGKIEGLADQLAQLRETSTGLPLQKVAIAGSVRVRPYDVIDNAVTLGVARGLDEARKHAGEEDGTAVIEIIAAAVMDGLAGALEFEHDKT